MIESLIVINEKGEKEGEIIKKNNLFSIASTPSGAFKSVPFFPNFCWDTTKDGNILFFDGCSNVIEIYNEKGKCLGKIVTSLPDSPIVTEKDFKQWKKDFEKRFVENRPKDEYDKYYRAIKNLSESIYKKKNIYEKLSVTPEGNILILEEKNIKDEYKYWLLNVKGEILAEKVTKARRLRITKNFILYITEEEEDDELLRCIKRKDSEKNDIALVK